MRRRLLAHSLSEALWDQLLLDVGGGGGVFTLGGTSYLIGITLAAAVSKDPKTNDSLQSSSNQYVHHVSQPLTGSTPTVSGVYRREFL